MNEEKPFEGENPFRKLDKKRFLSHDEKKKAKSLKKNGLISNNDGEASPSSLLRMKGRPEPF